jgi:hypothetical protein
MISARKGRVEQNFSIQLRTQCSLTCQYYLREILSLSHKQIYVRPRTGHEGSFYTVKVYFFMLSILLYYTEL